MTEEFKKTGSGVEYTEHTFKRNDGKESSVRLLRSMAPARLTEDEETFEEYRIRRKMINRAMKLKKKGQLLWNPYPFGKATNGMSYNDKNREIMKAVMEQQAKKQEEASNE